jgi:hypothetical protein
VNVRFDTFGALRENAHSLKRIIKRTNSATKMKRESKRASKAEDV